MQKENQKKVIKKVSASETLKKLIVGDSIELTNSQVSREVMRATCSRIKKMLGKTFAVQATGVNNYKVTRTA